MRRAVFSILVDNSSGVLSRVAGLFSRRGYNIDSLTVGETLDPKLSRMTITVTGDDDVLEQIEKQLGKLIDVKEIVAPLGDAVSWFLSKYYVQEKKDSRLLLWQIYIELISLMLQRIHLSFHLQAVRVR